MTATYQSAIFQASQHHEAIQGAGNKWVNECGCLYLNSDGKPVCPDPASPEFSKLTRHYSSMKGAWPRIVDN